MIDLQVSVFIYTAAAPALKGLRVTEETRYFLHVCNVYKFYGLINKVYNGFFLSNNLFNT